ncbi:WYL domain-containing protein [Weeksellaceae bacterium A-14]
MATNKNAQLRYKALDKCFSNFYKKYFIEDLIEYCSDILSDHYAMPMTVSRRQIFDDMDFMKSEAGYDAPIESFKDGRKTYYRYNEKEFSILQKPLTKSEIESLSNAMETLGRMSNIPGFDWADSIQAKLNTALDINNVGRKIISFEENEFLKGVDFLNPLYQHIINRQVLAVSYQSFKAEHPEIFVISPYFLKQYNNRWFLFGWNHELLLIQNLALDRICSIEISTTTFVISDLDFNDYFEDIIGVSNDLSKDVEKVSIELTPNIIPYISSKPIHVSQRIKGNILTIEVKHNYELESLILSFGENMKVLEPKTLQESLSNRISKMK